MGSSCTEGKIGLIFNSRGGWGPFTHVATALPAFLIGFGNHLKLSLPGFPDGRSHAGTGKVSEESDDDLTCRSAVVWPSSSSSVKGAISGSSR